MTDHKPLEFAIKSFPPTQADAQARRLAYITQFTTDIRYIKGSEKIVAGSLSRAPVPDETQELVTDLDVMTVTDPFLQLVALEQSRDSSLTSIPLNHTLLDQETVRHITVMARFDNSNLKYGMG
jgi:hypothetical protein